MLKKIWEYFKLIWLIYFDPIFFNSKMKPITLIRFNALAGYCREPQTLYMAEEVSWFEHSEERVIGIIIRDREDSEFGGVVLARDRNDRFCSVLITQFYPSQRRAEAFLHREMEKLSMAPDEEYFQGDEEGSPVDFFSSIAADERLNPSFVKLRDEPGFSPARGILEPMMRWYEDADGNFVEQFQTGGFDARIWELCLFATFTELGYKIDRTHAAPDFSCIGVPGEFAVEAVTVNATQDEAGKEVPAPPLNTEDEVFAFLREYMPIKFGSPLTSKLAKKYWEKPNVAGKPLLFAIQDFSSPGSMIRTRSGLPIYLYGYDHDWEYNDEGQLIITPRKVEFHQWGQKKYLPGFLIYLVPKTLAPFYLATAVQSPNLTVWV